MNLPLGRVHCDKLTLDYVSTGENILPKHLSKDLGHNKSCSTSSSSESVCKIEVVTTASQ